MLSFFLINFIFIWCYYKFSLAESISKNHESNITYLENTVREISKTAEEEKEFKTYLNNVAIEKGLILELKDRTGEVLYATGETHGVNVNISTQDVMVRNGVIYLLKVTWPIPLNANPAFRFISDLLYGEIIIISNTLLILTFIMHRHIVNPIVELQQIMLQYKNGKKPKAVKRCDEIGTLQQVYSELIDLLEADKQLQYRIVASISHDLKTPLTSVMGYAERLQKGTVSEERFNKYIQTIYTKSQMIKEIVDEFDDYVSVENQPGLKKQQVNMLHISNLLNQEYYNELNFLEIEFQVICNCPNSKVLVDLTKMNRVFGNIISNSLKYRSEGNLKITIEISKERDKIIFNISDNGGGVEEEDIKKIFEPFYTSDQSRRVAGLGLSICKSIVESHGGMISAYNNSDGGLSIRFDLEDYIDKTKNQ